MRHLDHVLFLRTAQLLLLLIPRRRSREPCPRLVDQKVAVVCRGEELAHAAAEDGVDDLILKFLFDCIKAIETIFILAL